jgi:hypothetical protein
MKQILPAFLFIGVLLFITPNAIAQENKKEQIAKALTDYFFLERENIHVHFDKKTFVTNEQVWFKGYVFHRKKNIPFFTTINIYATLMDEDGKVIDTQLVYGNIGSFTGKFKLNDTLKSGKYYLQFYTNWMNNFTEDESAVYEISIINQKTGAGNALAKADPSKINIEFSPEGGTLVQGITNTIGISIADCNHNPLPVSVVDIADVSGKVIKKVQVNKLGYGKFDLPANTSEGYKAIVTIEDMKHEQPLPAAQLTGIALEANNYAIAGNALIKVRTNKLTYESFGGKPVFLVAHQDDKAVVFEVPFTDKGLEQVLVVPDSSFFDGMNTLRLLDSNLNQLAERLLYKYPKSVLKADLNKTTESVGKSDYEGKVNYPNMNLSLSVLPETTMAFDDTNDIYGSFLILPYIENQKKVSGRYYLTSLSKSKAYELDLFLLNQKSKYGWQNILKNPPKDNYPFDMGLTMKGKVPTGKARYSKVRLFSLTSRLNELAEVDENNEFVYQNLIVPDSAYISFSLLTKGVKPKELNIQPQIVNGKRAFNKPFKPQLRCYIAQGPETAIDALDMPNVQDGTIMLEEIKIEGRRLKYEKSFGNMKLTGYKIGEMENNIYRSVIQFITSRGGFRVEQGGMGMDVHIYTRGRNSINGGQSEPIVYIDNIQNTDHNQLSNISMSDVDEIYMNPVALVPSIRNYSGIIKIYLKHGPTGARKNNTPDIIVKNGFQKVMPFENVIYNATEGRGFENFGLIDWEPSIMTDENGAFSFSIPKVYAKPVKVLIEGFSADGQLISEIKTLQ